MQRLKLSNSRDVTLILIAVVAASISPLAFTLSATGLYTFHWLGVHTIVPAVLVWFSILIYAAWSSNKSLVNLMLLSILAGGAGTVSMEIVRSIGFSYFHAMPGSLPMLMGVKLTDQFMVGPNWWSNMVGWGDHFWNGIGFTFIYLALVGKSKGRWWLGVLFSIAVGTTFMVSPVMNILGVGYFGHQFAPIAFPVTVYLAHIAWGVTFGFIAQHSNKIIASFYVRGI
ncbi:hypothetical protein GLP30_19140 [Photobacterium phosphoreum]|jgi:hypothetical protein|uniref:Uncharacterized protein n=1 Tax=Photobacterium phosphoreum TaxID=659 RepID=A0AAW4ZZ72_PHOPO|nr:hypothetical protein [Photobacterium phosphoreum]KJF87790.1 hypothetical protein UB41_04875 [Photobacterium phosphoreum]MCD9464500.1 hypothetical protein [Photobacterium phosphoreum]MCD9475478.1 hypothetical protein [Photobacterium phosphoreum]MCD9480050.1 hypothetical protein [Photobacterium phosphoreum]MCD9484438.1 hypothetical protein [Photobacterium phosphoreum]